MDENEKEIKKILSQDHGEDIPLEQIATEGTSPLNHKVIEKDIGGHTSTPPPEEAVNPESNGENTHTDHSQHYDDAPEQEINEDYSDHWQEEFEIPENEAKQTSDAFFGVANNLIEVGCGFLLKIKKHEEFYEFEEVIQVIDEQNEKNINRIKLDEYDQALLRPYLIQIAKQQGKKLSPENQFIAVLISIALKKGQAIMTIKKENKILTERIRNIIREEKGQAEPEEEEKQEPIIMDAPENQQGEEVVYEEITEEVPEVFVPGAEVVEVSEDNDPKPHKDVT